MIDLSTDRGGWSRRRWFVWLVIGLTCPGLWQECQAQRQVSEVAERSLEELMRLEVSSVARKRMKLNETAAAVYVITREQIQRSGATSIPELLRLVPGVHVARLDSSKWAVSARGFTGRFANKMLVLIDGRSVYTNLFSGVYWDQNDVLLEDIERIEVIRGPGATMWGANAVNGVVNIITRPAQDTLGTLVTSSFGTDDRVNTAVRHGMKVRDGMYARGFGRFFRRNELNGTTAIPGSDRWSMAQGGGRVDWDLSARDSIMMEGSGYGGKAFQFMRSFQKWGDFSLGDIDTQGGYFLGRWRRELSEVSDINLQVSSSVEQRREIVFGDFRNLDLDFQHRVGAAGRHDLMYGLGFRSMSARLESRIDELSFTPPERTDRLYSSFLQDDITLAPERLVLTAGVKLQHNGYTGWEWQPNARLLWTPNDHTGVWAALSRAVRTPSRQDRDLSYYFPLGPYVPGVDFVHVLSNDSLHSESVVTRELGYRQQFNHRLSADIALFDNHYTDLRTFAELPPQVLSFDPLEILAVASYSNSGETRSKGFEVDLGLNLTRQWKATANYSYLTMKVLKVGVADVPPALGLAFDTAPKHQVSLSNSWELSRRLTLDGTAWYVGALPAVGVDSYVRLDLGMRWKMGENGEASLALHNLTNGNHVEFFTEEYVVPTAVHRSVEAKWTWRF